jgi:signal peptidase II
LNRITLYSLAALIIVLDQLTKSWVVRSFQLEQSRDIVPGFFALTFVKNTGGAFSIFPHGTWALAFAAMVAVAAITVFVARAKMPLPQSLGLALALPLGGAAGNLIDRVRLNYVVDFLDVHIRDHHWPIFNVADSAICVGVTLLALRYSRVPVQNPEDAAIIPVKE